VSPDSPKKHRKFKEKNALSFTLLSDADHAVAERYGVWAKLLFWGRYYWGVARTTFVIDAQGRVAKVFEKVQPKDHGAEVADYIAANREALARK
jgi:thioredoxin-dependent peroxiredoxin